MAPSLIDPVPGYLDTLLGALGMTFGVAVGFMRVMNTSKKLGYDAIPVDVVVNATIVIIKEVSEQQRHSKIYNLVSNCGTTGGGEKTGILINT